MDFGFKIWKFKCTRNKFTRIHHALGAFGALAAFLGAAFLVTFLDPLAAFLGAAFLVTFLGAAFLATLGAATFLATTLAKEN